MIRTIEVPMTDNRGENITIQINIDDDKIIEGAKKAMAKGFSQSSFLDGGVEINNLSRTTTK